jgi:glutaryl-CoA dehydrogenase
MITPEKTRRARQPIDFVNVNSLLSDEEREIRDRVREHVDREIVPVMADYWDKAEFPFALIPGLGELGIMGGSFEKEYGCAGRGKPGDLFGRPERPGDGGNPPTR